jgi:hypothetical protein
MDKAWKRAERRMCRALGGERRGPTGVACSDCTEDVPWSVEIKYAKRGTPEGRWIEQAREQGKRDVKPWLLGVWKPRSPRPIAVSDFWTFASMADALGLVGPGEIVNPGSLIDRLAASIDPSSPIDADAHIAGVLDTLDAKDIDPSERRAADVPPVRETPQIAIFR